MAPRTHTTLLTALNTEVGNKNESTRSARPIDISAMPETVAPNPNPALSYTVRAGIATAAGAAYACGFPPVDQPVGVVAGLAGLLFAIRGERGLRGILPGLLFGLAAFGIGLSWLWNLFGAMAVALWCVLALFPAGFVWLQGRAMARDWSDWKLAAFTACNWGACEFIRAEVFPLKFPWMTVGLAIGPVRATPSLGVYVTGMVGVFAVALGMRLFRGPLTEVWKGWVAVALMGAALLSSPQPRNPTDGLEVAAVQLEGVAMNDYVEKTRALPEPVRHVVWPEYAVPFDLRGNARMERQLLDLCREKDITLTFGSRRDDDPAGGKWRNVALTMDATGIRGEHTKMHPVHFFDDGQAGTRAEPVTTAHGRAGTPVCFDGDYEGVFRKMAAAGAEFFATPVMDAIPWSAREHDQHAELYRIRAAETGRWVVVAATSGVSQIIDPTGKVTARLGAMEQGVLTGTIGRESTPTFHTRFGWLGPWLNLALAAVAAAWLVIGRRKSPTA